MSTVLESVPKVFSDEIPRLFIICPMGLKLCIGVYLIWSHQGKMGFPLETAYYIFLHHFSDTIFSMLFGPTHPIFTENAV